MKSHIDVKTVVLPLLVAATLSAQGATDRMPDAVVPFVDRRAAAVVRVDLQRIDVEAIISYAAELTGRRADEFDDVTAESCEALSGLRAHGVAEAYVVVSPAYLPAAPFCVIAPLQPGVDAKAVLQIMRDDWEGAEVIRGAVCAGPPGALEKLRSLEPARRTDLGEAFAAAGPGVLQMALAAPPDSRRVIEETLPFLPEEFGGVPTAPFTQGVQWAAASLQAPPEPSLRMTVKSPDAGAAQGVRDAFMQLVANMKWLEGTIPEPEGLVRGLTPQVRGTRVTLDLRGNEAKAVFADLLAPLRPMARDAKWKRAVMMNLRQIGISISEYMARYGTAPRNLEILAEKGYLRGNPLTEPDPLSTKPLDLVYRRPTDETPGSAIIVYEDYDQWPEEGVASVRLDVATQIVKDRQAFEEMLERGEGTFAE